MNEEVRDLSTLPVLLGAITVVCLLVILVVIMQPTSPPEPSQPTGATLPISEPTGKTYNPQQTVDGKALQGNEL